MLAEGRPEKENFSGLNLRWINLEWQPQICDCCRFVTSLPEYRSVTAAFVP